MFNVRCVCFHPVREGRGPVGTLTNKNRTLLHESRSVVASSLRYVFLLWLRAPTLAGGSHLLCTQGKQLKRTIRIASCNSCQINALELLPEAILERIVVIFSTRIRPSTHNLYIPLACEKEGHSLC